MRPRPSAALVAVGWLSSLVAYAQPAGGLPDLRAMAGRPLPVVDLAVGTVTIRVARKLPMNAVADIEVKGTVTEPDGKPGTTSVKTGADGRATFSGLAAGAEFQATATVDGEALTTSRFTVPRAGGTRVMLIAGIEAAQVGAGENEGAIDTDSRDNRFDAASLVGKVEDATDLPAGTLEMLAKNAAGVPVPDLKIRIGQVATGGQVKAFEATTGADGHARIADLAIGAGFAYAAVTEIDGQRVGSRPFRLPEGHGMRATIEPLASTQDLSVIEVVEPSYVVIEFREGGVVFQENFSLANTSEKMFDSGLGGLRFPLPKAALQAQAIPDGTPLEHEPQVAMILRSRIAPGGTRQPGARVRYAYLIPSNNDDELTVTRTYPIPIKKHTLLLLPGSGGNMELHGAGVTYRDSVAAENGTTVRRYLLDELPTGRPLTLTVTGIPTVSRTGHRVAAVLAILIAVVGAFAAFARPGGARDGEKRARTRSDLGNRRENLFAELVALERERRSAAAGTETARLDGKRRDLVAKIEAVYRDLAALDRGRS